MTTQTTNSRSKCNCGACIDGVLHTSDCAVHNAPAYKVGRCTCGAFSKYLTKSIEVEVAAARKDERDKAVREFAEKVKEHEYRFLRYTEHLSLKNIVDDALSAFLAEKGEK